MARQPRSILPEIALHVVQRGVDRMDCFRRDGDYMLYLLHLKQLAERFTCMVHAYCLMTNHVHLLLTPPSAEACAALMRNLGQRYVPWFNRTYGRTGTLWEGRFRSFPVESSRYALACYRYIEQNPVRASMVSSPRQYLWSSYRVNAGLACDGLITPHPEYLALGQDPARRHAAYRGMLEDIPGDTELDRIRESARSGLPLGGEAFVANLELGLGRALRPGKPGRPKSGSGPSFSGEKEPGPDPDFQIPL